MSDVDLQTLRAEIAKAKERERETLIAKGRIPILPTSEWLADGARTLRWSIVRRLRSEHAEAATAFPESHLGDLVLDVIESEDDVVSLGALAGKLLDLARAEGPWLVATPIANIRLTDAVVELGPQTVLRRTYQGREWLTDRFATTDEDVAADCRVRAILGERLATDTQWVQFEDVPVDTTRGATLLWVHDGVPSVALARARARAEYAIAVWSLVAPPSRFEVVPDLGLWVPQPTIYWLQRYKQKTNGSGIGSESVRGGGVRRYAPYTAPDPDVLKLPFEAFERLDRRCVQALLSASLSLHYGMRRSGNELSAQLRNTLASLENLCEKEGDLWAADGRWDTISNRLGVWAKVTDEFAYTTDDITEVQKRVKAARNIATHGADAALLDLGYPSAAQRKVSESLFRPGTDFAYTALAADLEPLRYALGEVIASLWQTMRASDWDDTVFEQQFADAPST